MQQKTLFLFVSLALLAAQTARTATITVTSLADSGPGSLRSSLASAIDGDTIDATGVSGTIFVTSGELLITTSVTILGPGPGNLALDGGFSIRLIHVDSDTVVSVSGLAILNGISDLGGGVFNQGTLVISNSVLTGNIAFAGGGIYNDSLGTVTIERCLLTDNSVEYAGGAFCNAGLAVVNNSTLKGNLVGYGGGAIYSAGTLQVNNSTLSGNTAYNFGGAIEVDGGNVTINNSIVALNSAPSDADIGGSFAGGFNFIGGDPSLGPLADNGGPTMTMALLPGSPCSNAGNPGFPGSANFDQRGPGFARVSGGCVDIGAFEVQEVTQVGDSDGDGVLDDVDQCPDTPAGEIVDASGCPISQTGDSDGDGVLDDVDQCPDTPAGDIVNASGCSISQLVPCDGPQSGETWKNHGQYVRAVVKAAKDFFNAGLITRRQGAKIVTDAAHSSCGKLR
jgi:hypothetical protein